MKNRFRLIRYRRRGGIYCLHDKQTGTRKSLDLTNKARANEILVAENEAAREPSHNLQKGRIYLNAADPLAATRTWGDTLNAVMDSKPKDSEVRLRWERFAKDEALETIVDIVLLETLPDQVLKATEAQAAGTTTFRRRLQNFCVGMGWRPWPALPPKMWRKNPFQEEAGDQIHRASTNH